MKELMSDHLVHLIKNYIYPGEYITKHIIVTFIPPILYYLHERLRYNQETDYFYNLITNTFSLAVKKMEDGLFPIHDNVIDWVNGDIFKQMIRDIIKHCIIDKVAVVRAYNDKNFEENKTSIDEIHQEIKKINEYIEKNNEMYKEKIIKLYYEGPDTIKNFCEGR